VNSSIFSSSQNRFLAAAVALLLALMMLEAVTRLLLYPASRDFVRFASYPGRARNLVSQPGLRVALIGNSAIEEAVDLAWVKENLQAQGLGPIDLDMFLADGSGITTWRFMMERYFWRPGLKPDLFVVTYFESRLEDGSEDDLGRLAQFFTTPADWPDLFRTDLKDLSERMEFLLSTAWATYAARARIKDRVLALVVPDYKEFTFGLNGAAVHHSQRLAEHTTPPSRQYRVLNRALKKAREAGTPICIIAFPMRLTINQSPYPIDPELKRVAEAGGADFIDLRVMPELGFEDYRDPIHLRAAGREKYSRRLTEILAAKLRSVSATGTVPTANAGRSSSVQFTSGGERPGADSRRSALPPSSSTGLLV
jgi:hypothetical protein